MNDTITAIATSSGVGAISVIRVSGNESISIVNKITKSKRLEKLKSHTIKYDYIVNNKEFIDEVLISIMKAPKSFTTEDVVEISCHGGIATTNKILELLLSNGCRLAEPGEFTKRAFLNGRIDLIKAEGIMDLINSKTDKARNLAINQITGKVTTLIQKLRQSLIEILANIEVNIDYPEYEDIEEITILNLKNKLILLESEIQKIINESQNGKLIKEGINVALIGKPNVGKSSILNNLLEEKKAIVTEIAGTTRDYVEGTIILDGIILNIIDTAGIRETTDVVESIGVNKSLEILDQADLIIFIVDSNDLNNNDKEILEKIKNKKHLIVINKIDLKRKIDISSFASEKIIYMSALNDQGTDILKMKIKELFNFEELEQGDISYLTNAYSLAILNNCLDSISDIKNGIDNNLPIDILEIDLKYIWEQLGKIIGENYDEELIDQLFSQFCLGK